MRGRGVGVRESEPAHDPEEMRHETVRRARSLRRPLTPAESSLWRFLRNGHVAGLRFRRQHPIGRYIADFCCVDRKLVVELDGYSHEDRDRSDAYRTAAIEARGYRVVRFTNDDVARDVLAVVSAIAQECGVRWEA